MTPALRLLVLTERRLAATRGRSVVEVARDALGAGASAIVLREKDLPRDARRRLAEHLRVAADAAGGRLIVASDAGLAQDMGCEFVHLAVADEAPPGGTPSWGRSCHDRAQVEAAVAEGAAYVVAAPVFATASKPGYGPPLGVEGLRDLVSVSGRLPMVGLGGVTNPGRISACMAAGAVGVAVMGAVMAAEEPAAVVAELLAAVCPTGVA